MIKKLKKNEKIDEAKSPTLFSERMIFRIF